MSGLNTWYRHIYDGWSAVKELTNCYNSYHYCMKIVWSLYTQISIYTYRDKIQTWRHRCLGRPLWWWWRGGGGRRRWPLAKTWRGPGQRPNPRWWSNTCKTSAKDLHLNATILIRFSIGFCDGLWWVPNRMKNPDHKIVGLFTFSGTSFVPHSWSACDFGPIKKENNLYSYY